MYPTTCSCDAASTQMANGDRHSETEKPSVLFRSGNIATTLFFNCSRSVRPKVSKVTMRFTISAVKGCAECAPNGLSPGAKK